MASKRPPGTYSPSARTGRSGGGAGGVAGMVRRAGPDALPTVPVDSWAASIRRWSRPDTAFRGCFDIGNPLPGLADPDRPGAPTDPGFSIGQRPGGRRARASHTPRIGTRAPNLHTGNLRPRGVQHRSATGRPACACEPHSTYRHTRTKPAHHFADFLTPTLTKGRGDPIRESGETPGSDNGTFGPRRGRTVRRATRRCARAGPGGAPAMIAMRGAISGGLSSFPASRQNAASAHNAPRRHACWRRSCGRCS